jgi:hypothetical protein
MPQLYYPEKRALPNWTGGWMGLRVGLDMIVPRKTSAPVSFTLKSLAIWVVTWSGYSLSYLSHNIQRYILKIIQDVDYICGSE